MIVLPSSAGIYRPFAGSTAWTPSSLPLLAWYKADAGVLDASDNPVTADSTAVKTWQDQSGNGRHLVQNTSASRPVFRTAANSFSSLPALEASGSQFLENTALSLGSDVSVYVVCKLVGTPTDFTGVFQLGSNHAHLLFNDNTQHFRIQGVPTGSISDVVSGAAATNTRQVLKMDLATTVFRFKQSADGINSATNPTTITLGTGYKLFQNYIGTATCQISEYILCSRVLTSGEEASLNDYLKTRYAVDANAIYYTLPVSGAALWLDGSRLDSLYTTDTGSTNVSTNAGAIGRWEDLSGNARHGKQATAGSRPTWVSPAFGRLGLGATIANGSSQFFTLDNTSSWGLVYSGDFTINAVIKATSTGGVIIGQSNGPGTTPKWSLGYGSNGIVGSGQLGLHYNGNPSGFNGFVRVAWSPTAGTYYRITATRTGNDHLFFVNGVQQGTTQTTTNRSGLPTNAATVFQLGNGDGGFFGGQVAELTVYASYLSGSQITDTNTYFSGKWGT